MIVPMTSALEATLFAAGSDGLRTSALAQILQVSESEAEALCHQLRGLLDARESGLQLLYHDHVWQLVTRPEYGPYLSRMANGPQQSQLSQAALEVLAIIAYQQPISRMGVEEVRGVQSDRAIATLMHRQLIQEVGRLETPGRPILYGTTSLFLQSFGFQTLDDLPPLPDPDDGPLELNLFDMGTTAPRD